MNSYVTGAVIRNLREGKKLTQEELAEKLYVSSKTVSKWETGKGYPDMHYIFLSILHKSYILYS